MKCISSKVFPLIILLMVSSEVLIAQNDEVFMIVEQPAKPEGGYEEFYKYVQSMLKYPAEARRDGIEGRVYVQFVVDTNGDLTEVQVVKGIGGGCDLEAHTVISSAPRWHAAEHRGKRVKQRIILPITFKL